MSFDDLHSSLSPSGGRPRIETIDIEPDVKLFGSPVEESHVDDSELLARLDSADSMASGVEARLDGILGTLDDLLTRLEPKGGGGSQEVAIPRPESQSEHPPSEHS